MLRRFGWRRCAAAAAAAANPVSESDTVPEASALTPRQAVAILDKYIIGQRDGKKAMAVALRARWRRKQIPDEGLRNDVTPKNILMVGPTGVGKTEIARRMARLTDAPFVKVEATKYTEVGFKGKDVESIIEDLYTASKQKARQRLETERGAEAAAMAMDTLLTAAAKAHPERMKDIATAELFKAAFDKGELDDLVVAVTMTVKDHPPGGNPRNRGPEGAPTIELFTGFEPKAKTKTLHRPMKEAFDVAKKEALPKLIDDAAVQAAARALAEEDGIVFLDEIDKVVVDAGGAADNDVSAVGVQQDLLPIVEGSAVTMKDGTVIKTDNVLFICSGAFHSVKPSSMIAELQGRLPVRVQLQPLKEAEFVRILKEPKFNILRQQIALLAVERIDLSFTDECVTGIARAAADLNANAQNIGARRLHTILERVVDDVSFDCAEYAGKAVALDGARVEAAIKPLMKKVELAKYLL